MELQKAANSGLLEESSAKIKSENLNVQQVQDASISTKSADDKVSTKYEPEKEASRTSKTENIFEKLNAEFMSSGHSNKSPSKTDKAVCVEREMSKVDDTCRGDSSGRTEEAKGVSTETSSPSTTLGDENLVPTSMETTVESQTPKINDDGKVSVVEAKNRTKDEHSEEETASIAVESNSERTLPPVDEAIKISTPPSVPDEDGESVLVSMETSVEEMTVKQINLSAAVTKDLATDGREIETLPSECINEGTDTSTLHNEGITEGKDTSEQSSPRKVSSDESGTKVSNSITGAEPESPQKMEVQEAESPERMDRQDAKSTENMEVGGTKSPKKMDDKTFLVTKEGVISGETSGAKSDKDECTVQDEEELCETKSSSSDDNVADAAEGGNGDNQKSDLDATECNSSVVPSAEPSVKEQVDRDSNRSPSVPNKQVSMVTESCDQILSNTDCEQGTSMTCTKIDSTASKQMDTQSPHDKKLANTESKHGSTIPCANKDDPESSSSSTAMAIDDGQTDKNLQIDDGDKTGAVQMGKDNTGADQAKNPTADVNACKTKEEDTSETIRNCSRSESTDASKNPTGDVNAHETKEEDMSETLANCSRSETADAPKNPTGDVNAHETKAEDMSETLANCSRSESTDSAPETEICEAVQQGTEAASLAASQRRVTRLSLQQKDQSKDSTTAPKQQQFPPNTTAPKQQQFPPYVPKLTNPPPVSNILLPSSLSSANDGALTDDASVMKLMASVINKVMQGESFTGLSTEGVVGTSAGNQVS